MSPSTKDLTGRLPLWVSRPESLALYDEEDEEDRWKGSKNPNTWKQEKWDDNIKRKQEDRKQKKEVGKEGGRNEMVR